MAAAEPVIISAEAFRYPAHSCERRNPAGVGAARIAVDVAVFFATRHPPGGRLDSRLPASPVPGMSGEGSSQAKCNTNPRAELSGQKFQPHFGRTRLGYGRFQPQPENRTQRSPMLM